MKKAVFLDRDGTINVEKNYLVKYEEWEFIDGAQEAIKGFHELGFCVIVISNQAGIARGYYTADDVKKLHEKVNLQLKKQGCCIDAFYICPHHPDINLPCDCRKPAPGMLFKAADELDIDLSQSYMIGDKLTDVLAGINAGVRAMMVRTGYGEKESELLKDISGGHEVAVFDNIFSVYQAFKAEKLCKKAEDRIQK